MKASSKIIKHDKYIYRLAALSFLFFCAIIVLLACKKDKPKPNKIVKNDSYGIYNPTAYNFNYSSLFQNLLFHMPTPSDNPTTVQGIALGRKLFYDKTLSGDNNISCASCHNPNKSFSDSPNAITNVGGTIETRNTPAIINLGWAQRLFWDGRVYLRPLENQALEPVVNSNEMHSISWTQVAQELQSTPNYPKLFYQAFGTDQIDSSLVVDAIAQFERTLISDNSKMDRYLLGETSLTSQEQAGLDLFMSEEGNCFHCHGNPNNPLWTDNGFHDTGLDATYTDLGLGAVTGNPADNGKFKTPTLRNLLFTAPYMHDGRFQTLEQVIDFYSTGIKHSPNLDPNFYRVDSGGANFTQQQKDALIAFLKTLSDSSYLTNSSFQAP